LSVAHYTIWCDTYDDLFLRALESWRKPVYFTGRIKNNKEKRSYKTKTGYARKTRL